MFSRLFCILIGFSIPLFAQAIELNEEEKIVVEKSVREALKDPESARFKWLPLADKSTERGATKSIVYCGLVNSRNSFGGYTGDVPFAVFLVWTERSELISGLVGIGLADRDSPRTKAILETCAKQGYTDFYLAE